MPWPQLVRIVLPLLPSQQQTRAGYVSRSACLAVRMNVESGATTSAAACIECQQSQRSRTSCSEAALTTGYSPFLSFTVDRLQPTLERLLPMGAEMDGPVQFTKYGQLAAIRNPDGHMMTLLEPTDAQT